MLSAHSVSGAHFSGKCLSRVCTRSARNALWLRKLCIYIYATLSLCYLMMGCMLCVCVHQQSGRGTSARSDNDDGDGNDDAQRGG